MIAKSRISSSELGALSHSAKSASGNSLPMTGVTSKDLNCSRIPSSFNGSLLVETACFVSPFTWEVASWMVSLLEAPLLSTVVAEGGAMTEVYKVRLGYRIVRLSVERYEKQTRDKLSQIAASPSD